MVKWKVFLVETECGFCAEGAGTLIQVQVQSVKVQSSVQQIIPPVTRQTLQRNLFPKQLFSRTVCQSLLNTCPVRLTRHCVKTMQALSAKQVFAHRRIAHSLQDTTSHVADIRSKGQGLYYSWSTNSFNKLVHSVLKQFQCVNFLFRL